MYVCTTIFSLTKKRMDKSEIQQVKMRFGIIGNAESLNRAIDVAMQVAATDLTVLITGESGVGKESFPKIIHQYSRRKHGPYIAVNCGAIPEGTIDSELFGHEKGAFTGAIGERKGYFGEANGGTIFLDEVGELPLSTQARLLRVLETGEFMKVGSSKVEKTDVRIVAATNVNFSKAISQGKFREDLYYRLSTVPIQIVPLRERKNDIILLFKKFASDFAEKYRMPGITLTDKAKEVLSSYRWPGNIRQLKNITEQISIIEKNREIDEDTIRRYLPEAENMQTLPALSDNTMMFGHEKEILYQIIREMKNEIAELQKTVRQLENGGNNRPQTQPAAITYKYLQPVAGQQKEAKDEPQPFSIEKAKDNYGSMCHEVEPEYIIEKSMSLQDLEKESIKKALERHKGKRKAAAEELKISERTLYRKIKEYGLEEK